MDDEICFLERGISMSNEYEMFNQQRQRETEKAQGGNRHQKGHPASTIYNPIINTVGPDLSIRGKHNEGKTIRYDYNQQQSLFGHYQSFTSTDKGDAPWHHSDKQMEGNAHWQHCGNHQFITPQCCCYPYLYYGYYPYKYRY